jgi:quercetin dioxygenase-like cupin family protein
MGDREVTERTEVLKVGTVAIELLDEARQQQARRAARTLVSGNAQRATVIALAEGAQMAEHKAPPAATLHVIAGRVRLHTADHEWLLDAGDLVRIPPQRHALDAITDTAVLLTVALH